MGEQYTYLPERAESIKASMKLEEERFFKTIEDGIKLFNAELENTKESFNGEVAFKLYDTYGFPLDLTEDMLREKNIVLDINAFNAKMDAQKAQSKAGWKGTGEAAATGDFKEIKESFGVNEFVGYEKTSSEATVLALLDENFKKVEELNGKGWVYLSNTPLYAESGGQVGDRGVLEIVGQGLPSPTLKVTSTKKFLDMNLSEVEGSIKVCDKVVATVDSSRTEIERHHSATHLLHAGLREILGDHIAQAGSLNDDKRLRFDFSHPKAVTAQELAQVEAWVNDKISSAIQRETKVMSVDAAKEAGAMALFGEKYGDEVRVVSMGNASVELCGGTHVNNLSEIGIFMISKESGVSAGVRRIEAVCSKSAISEINALRTAFNEVKTELKNQNPMAGISKLKEDVKSLKAELKTALSSTKKELTASELNGTTIIVEEVEAGDIKELIDEAKNKYPNIAIMLFQKKGDKVLIACGSKETSIKAGNWIKEIAPVLGGGGGGRADFAQAGGKDASKIAEAKERALAYLAENL
jgi:alanyl-tRNA synthetase